MFCATANLRTKILDFRGFDSSINLKFKGEQFPESLSQAILVGIILVGKSAASPAGPGARPDRAPRPRARGVPRLRGLRPSLSFRASGSFAAILSLPPESSLYPTSSSHVVEIARMILDMHDLNNLQSHSGDPEGGRRGTGLPRGSPSREARRRRGRQRGDL